MLGQSHQALGWTYKEHKLAKRGFAALKAGRTAQNDSAAIAVLWRLVATLTGVEPPNPEPLFQMAADISDHRSAIEADGAQLTPEGDCEASMPFEEMDMNGLLGVFMSTIAPALVEELVRLYGRRTVDDRLTTTSPDGALVVECETVLEFVYRNWCVPMTRGVRR